MADDGRFLTQAGGQHSMHTQEKKPDQAQKSFSVFIINSAGQMLIQKRSSSKQFFPGLWSNTCSSKTLLHESSHVAAQRRLYEELGLECPLYEAFPFMYRTRTDTPYAQAYNHVFIGICDADPKPNIEEISAVRWVSIPDLLQDMQEHQNCYTPWFRFSIEGVALFIHYSLFSKSTPDCLVERGFEPRFITSTPIKVEQLVNVVEKSWGHEEWIVNNADYCGKRLVFVAGHQCSMHHHKIKMETFYVLAGKISLETRLDEQISTRIMTPGDIAHMTRGMWHQVTALENSEIIEFSTFHMDEDSYRMSTEGEVNISNMNYELEEAK